MYFSDPFRKLCFIITMIYWSCIHIVSIISDSITVLPSLCSYLHITGSIHVLKLPFVARWSLVILTQ